MIIKYITLWDSSNSILCYCFTITS